MRYKNSLFVHFVSDNAELTVKECCINKVFYSCIIVQGMSKHEMKSFEVISCFGHLGVVLPLRHIDLTEIYSATYCSINRIDGINCVCAQQSHYNAK